MTNENKDPRLADHLANERTFLAWIRTSLGIIAFGFVIERFGLFIKQMGLIVGKLTTQNATVPVGFSEMIGILIVGFGTIISLLAYLNFRKVEKHILQGTSSYQSSVGMYGVLIIGIVVMGGFLVVYLMQNISPGVHTP